MDRKKKFLAIFVPVLGFFVALGLLLPLIDNYPNEGELFLPALQQKVIVHRDDLGIPYLNAQSIDDLITAQGFVTAQDRLFQMELYKYLAHGRLAELIGEKGLKSDRLVRLLDFSSLAKRQEEKLSPAERNFIQRYINGVNAYINDQSENHPLVFKMLKTQARPWEVSDALAIQFFQIWSSSVNWRRELLTLQLIEKLGPERAATLAPLNINPDDPASVPELSYRQYDLQLNLDADLFSDQNYQHAMGSNAWASGSRKSKNGAPILVNDPHIDVRHLPGFWYPMGLLAPGFRAVGGATPGLPGLGVGRSNAIAWGATNGYADMVDLYIEQVDPNDSDRYLDGDNSLPFVMREELIKIKDAESNGGYRLETLRVRSTPRGPVISDDSFGITTIRDKVISLRWSVPEFIGSDAGNRELLFAKSVDAARQAIGKMATPLNYIVVDYDGNIARLSSGFVPKRVRGIGLTPLYASAEDSWDGRIPPAQMPAQINPPRDWVGSANQRVTDADYPYAYSTHFSPAWRYLRLMELLSKDELRSKDHWQFLMDNKNLMAERMVPVMVTALNGEPGLKELADILGQWDFMDNKEQAAPLVFHTLYSHFAKRVYGDEMGAELSMAFLKETYYFQQRFVEEFLADESEWFDDVSSKASKENRDQLLRMAGQDTLLELKQKYGEKSRHWQWGDRNQLTFFHSVFPGSTAAKWLGGGVHPSNGSVETLNRAVYLFDKPEEVKVIPSMRIVIDLSDPDKVEAHIPGGVSERLFSPFAKNQLPLWLEGKPAYWWFSDKAIEENARFTLSLLPD